MTYNLAANIVMQSLPTNMKVNNIKFTWDKCCLLYYVRH